MAGLARVTIVPCGLYSLAYDSICVCVFVHVNEADSILFRVNGLSSFDFSAAFTPLLWYTLFRFRLSTSQTRTTEWFWLIQKADLTWENKRFGWAKSAVCVAIECVHIAHKRLMFINTISVLDLIKGHKYKYTNIFFQFNFFFQFFFSMSLLNPFFKHYFKLDCTSDLIWGLVLLYFSCWICNSKRP